MTRNMAINEVGEEAVKSVESENCEMTGRLMPDGCGLTEWSASTPLDDGGSLIIYYYTDKDDDNEVEENGGDWGAVNWSAKIDRYEII